MLVDMLTLNMVYGVRLAALYAHLSTEGHPLLADVNPTVMQS